MNKLKSKELLKMLEFRNDVFCHISWDIKKDNNFIPRVPEITRDDENKEINRVCVSESLEGAFSGMAGGGSGLSNFTEDNAMYFKVYIIDIKKLGISKDSMYSPKYLVDNGYVLDAEITREHWIMESFTVPEEDTLLLSVNSYTEYEECIDVPLSDGTYQTDEITTICNLDVTTEDVDTGEIIKISLEYPESELEKEELMDIFLSTNPDIEFLNTKSYEAITIRSKKKQNIYKLMYNDYYYKMRNIYGDIKYNIS